MDVLVLEDIDVKYNEIFEDSANEESEEEDSILEDESDEDEDYEMSEEEGDEDEDDEEEEPDFDPFVFELSDNFKFASLITKSNSQTAIYKATCRTTQVTVCIKITLNKLNQIPIEVKILEYIKRLGGHKNIQALLGVCHFPDAAWVVITKFYESIKEEDIFGHKDIIHNYTKQLLEGLQFLHSNSIIHRDIKPSNLLWDGTILIIIDFDLACWNHKQGHTQCVGTDGYVAPEVLCFHRDVAERVNYFQQIDLYSVGCVFAGLNHSVSEDSMEERYFYVWRKKYIKSKETDDQLFLGLIHHNTAKRLTAQMALQSDYILQRIE